MELRGTSGQRSLQLIATQLGRNETEQSKDKMSDLKTLSVGR